MFHRYPWARRRRPRVLKVIARFLSGAGFIVTALFVKRPLP